MDTNTQVTDINVNDDAYASADSALPMARAYYGQIQLDIWFCALVKGTGKVPYDPTVHKQRATAVNISVLPLSEQNVTFDLRRELIAESHEWAGIVWPSLKALGIASTRAANNQWVKMQQVPSGRKYRNSSGEEKESTTFKFLSLYPDETACRAAYLADTGRSDAAAAPAQPAQPAQAPLENAAPASETDHALKVAIPFINAFAKQADFDLEVTKTMCKKQAVITKAIDVESVRFAELVAQAATAAA